MTPGGTDEVPWFDRLLARWEVSRLAVVSFSISLFAAPISWLILSLALFGGRRSAIVAVLLLVVWAVLVGLDQLRGWWLCRHLHASPRWLRAVRAAVGDVVFEETLAHLTILTVMIPATPSSAPTWPMRCRWRGTRGGRDGSKPKVFVSTMPQGRHNGVAIIPFRQPLIGIRVSGGSSDFPDLATEQTVLFGAPDPHRVVTLLCEADAAASFTREEPRSGATKPDVRT